MSVAMYTYDSNLPVQKQLFNLHSVIQMKSSYKESIAHIASLSITMMKCHSFRHQSGQCFILEWRTGEWRTRRVMSAGDPIRHKIPQCAYLFGVHHLDNGLTGLLC